MPEINIRDQHLSLIENAMTVLLYVAMPISSFLISYGVYLNYESTLTGIVNALLALGLSYIGIILISTTAQRAYSNLYDDTYRPRRVKMKNKGDWQILTAGRMPKNTSLILAEEDDTNIADYHNSPREFKSTSQDFKLKQTENGVEFKNGDYKELFDNTELDDLQLYMYRNSFQCRWNGDPIKVIEQ